MIEEEPFPLAVRRVLAQDVEGSDMFDADARLRDALAVEDRLNDPRNRGITMIRPELTAVTRSVRSALQSVETTEEERAQFLYDLVREVYDHVKFDVHGPTVDASERAWIGSVVDAALPPR